MPEEMPAFSERPLGEAKPKKKTGRRRQKMAPKSALQNDPKMVDKYLKDIYRDENGGVPDMRTIAIKPDRPMQKFLLRLLVTATIFAAGIWVAWYLWPQLPGVAAKQPEIAITGAVSPSAGDRLTYAIHYRNPDSAPLRDGLLQIYAPAGFIVEDSSEPAQNGKKTEWTLGTIPPETDKTIQISGRFYGPVDQTGSWRAVLTYQPDKVTARLRSEAALAVKISSSPFTLAIQGPSVVSPGSPANYTITVNAPAAIPAGRMELVPEFPANFTLASSSPALAKNKSWLIAAGSPSSTAAAAGAKKSTFLISGFWSEQASTTAKLAVALAWRASEAAERLTLTTSALGAELAKNDVTLSVAVNGTLTDFDAKPGDLLNATVQVKNNSDREIKNATVNLVFDAPARDRQSLLNWAAIVDPADGDLQGEQINASRRRGTIVWTSKQVPALARLAAGAAAAIDFRLPLRDGKNFDLASLKESSIAISGKTVFTDSGNASVTVAANPIAITVNSDLAFEPEIAITTDNGARTFKILWVVRNSFHPLKDLDISASLFGESAWSAGDKPTSGELQFDPKTQTMRWHIADMPADVDVATAGFTITLAKDNPSQNTLVSKPRLEAEDTVTHKKIEFLGEEIPLTH